MTKDQTHAIALMRYSLIAPLISGLSDQYESKEAFFRDVSTKGVRTPSGNIKHFAPTSIKRWYNNYNRGGFDALLPSTRSDTGKSRKLDEALQEQIEYLKSNYPRMSAAAIFRQLREKGSIKPGELSEATINRFIKHLAIEQKTTTNQDMRRYERPHINEVWCGDTSVGPYLKTNDGKKHKVFIIALIDDASRFIVGIDVFFNDNFVNLMSVMKSAVAKYGRPQMYNFDNGSSFKNKQMELLAARTGSVLHYDRPYTPTQKAKIERWFRTMKDQWLACLDIRDFHSLDELRGNLLAYVQRYNQSPHSSLKGFSPQDRFFSEPERIRRLSDEDIQKHFLLEIERRVSIDCVISIDQVAYEVDYRFAKQRIRLRYSPDMTSIFIVEHDGTFTPIRLLNKHENAFVKREKLHLCRGEEI
ncbi:MAG TPA: IS481 family transposase [Clostridiales bacterium UBA8960]|jgi:transposase InsO family protein|nr:IS481 family transposase [Clostridiales bacterium UBA8960]